MNEPELTPGAVALAVLLAALGLLAVTVLVSPRAGILALAAFALAGAGARVLAPRKRAFAVRRRAIDVTVLAVFGLVLGYLGLTTPLG